jgi:phospholipid/cholesterol/gamma-HCH transport system ATP-binding protein
MPVFAFMDEIYKSFDGKEVLRGLTLTIRRGEMLFILGGSGAGKTVTLKMLVGLVAPDRGDIHLDEGVSCDFHDSDWLAWRRKVGFLLQSGGLFDSMNVMDNVAFPLREHTQLSGREIEEKVREKLKWVQLEGVEKTMPDKLSGGMRKRVALARAIALQPQAMLYDEPTTGLDPITTTWVTKLMRNMHDRLALTSVVVTHNLSSAFQVADRIAFLYRGRFKFVGTPKEFQQSEDQIIQQFVKS